MTELEKEYALSSESRLTSGLRELAEKWRKEAQQLDEHPVNYDPSLILQECVRELLALIPEATKPSLATKEVPDGR